MSRDDVSRLQRADARHGFTESRVGLDAVLDAWLAAHTEGIACVIGDPTFRARPGPFAAP